MEFKKIHSDAYDIKMKEYESSQIVKQKALIDYLSMMTGVELPEESSEQNGAEHESEI